MRHVLQDYMVTRSREFRAPDNSLISDHWSKENLHSMPYLTNVFLTLALLITSLRNDASCLVDRPTQQFYIWISFVV